MFFFGVQFVGSLLVFSIVCVFATVFLRKYICSLLVRLQLLCEIVLLCVLVWLCVLCDSSHYLAVGERRSFRESAECSSIFRLDWLDNQVEEELSLYWKCSCEVPSILVCLSLTRQISFLTVSSGMHAATFVSRRQSQQHWRCLWRACP